MSTSSTPAWEEFNNMSCKDKIRRNEISSDINNTLLAESQTYDDLQFLMLNKKIE